LQSGKKYILIGLVLLILILIGVNIWMGQFEKDASKPADNPFANLISKPKIGSPVPDFELPTLDGKKVSVSRLRGKSVVLNFWASWCASCIVEMPLLQTASEKHPDDLKVLAINIEEPASTVDAYTKKYPFKLPILLDLDGKVAHNFGVFAYPTSIFIDKEGIIRSQYVGQLDEIQLQKKLETIGISPW
jgi:peroxiredoxin